MVDETKPKKKNRFWKILLRIVLVLAVVGGVGYYFYNSNQNTQAQTVSQLQTVALSRQTFTTSISGTGTVRPNQSITLNWETSGTVASPAAAVGDKVTLNQVLLKLDPDNLPLDILQASLDKLNAEQALANLEANTVLQRSQLNANIASAQSQLSSLQDQLQILVDRNCPQWRIDDLQSTYDSELKTYQDWPTETQLAKVNQAKSDLDFCNPDTLNRQKSDLQSQIDLQNKTIADWQSQLDKIKDGPNPDDKQKLELQLQIAEKRLGSQQILAPFDGEVTSVMTKAGDLVFPSMPAIEISDLTSLYVDVPISEVDIPLVKVGQKAQFVFDAFFNTTFTGEVTDVALVGREVAGVVNYTVTIKLDDGLDQIKPGMTAGVSILVEEKPDALVVPTEAVVNRNGNDMVYVLRNNTPVAVEVTIGGYSNTVAEIIAGDVKEGDLIVLNPPTSILDTFQNQPLQP